MSSSVQKFHYSYNNPYASDYYNACYRFENVRNKILKYERNPDSMDSAEYKKLQEDFAYWDKRVPETSNRAGAYEEQIKQRQEQRRGENQEGKTVHYPSGVGEHLNFLA